jgi:hypothetical protein
MLADFGGGHAYRVVNCGFNDGSPSGFSDSGEPSHASRFSVGGGHAYRVVDCGVIDG